MFFLICKYVGLGLNSPFIEIIAALSLNVHQRYDGNMHNWRLSKTRKTGNATMNCVARNIHRHKTSSFSTCASSRGGGWTSLSLSLPLLSSSIFSLSFSLPPFYIIRVSLSFSRFAQLTSGQSGMIGLIHAFALTTLSKLF